MAVKPATRDGQGLPVPFTTCTAVLLHFRMDNAARAGAAFEAMLLEPVLQPLTAAFGELGGYGLNLLAREVAAKDGNAFARLVSAALEPAR